MSNIMKDGSFEKKMSITKSWYQYLSEGDQ